MLPSDVLNLARQKPFVPFRIYLADGRTLEVPHPDMILVGAGSVVVGTPDPANPRVYSGVQYVDMMLIVSLEPLPRPAPSQAGAGGE
ncbi:MAG TPA: hypothetical protein VMG10_36550 [Gemmataceae bacterium]|nr:hypothetical protein [Gemmataceae bacterium]